MFNYDILSCQLSPAQDVVLKFLRHLLPIISSSFTSATTSSIINKVNTDLDFFLPFRQHAPSLANARREIYANGVRLAQSNGIGFFNVLAFRGVFFGSPFAQSNRFRWFESLDDWLQFDEAGKTEAERVGPSKEYYVNTTCYGQSQRERSTNLLPLYWNVRKRWNDIFNKPTKPTVLQVYRWLALSKEGGHSLFRNIGELTALLICGDLVEAGIITMPSSQEMGELISRVQKGARAGLETFELVSKGANGNEVCQAFVSLDAALQHLLQMEEKVAMGYNVIMLEHVLCKMKRLTKRGISKENFLSDI